MARYLTGEHDEQIHTQEEVAEAMGVNQATVSSLLGKGRVQPRLRFTYDRIRQLARIMKIHETVITGENPAAYASAIHMDVAMAALVGLGIQKTLASVILANPGRWKIDDVAYCNRSSASLSEEDWKERLDRAAGLDSRMPPAASEATPRRERKVREKRA